MWNLTTRGVVAAIASAATFCASEASDCLQPKHGACSQLQSVPEVLGTDVSRTPDNPRSGALPPGMYDAAGIGTIAPPVAVRLLDEGLSAQTSLGSWRDYNAQVLTRKVEEGAKELTPKEAGRAKVGTAPSAPLDLWTKLEVQGLASDTAGRIRTGLGADYKVSRSTKIGVSAEHLGVLEGGTEAPLMDKVGAYVTVRPVPTLSIETRGQLQAERPGAVMGADGAQPGIAEEPSLLIKSRVAKQFSLSEGSTIEPFVMLGHQLGSNAVDEGGSMGLAESAGIGVTVSRGESYALSVTADVDNVAVPDKAEATSKVQLKVPLR